MFLDFICSRIYFQIIELLSSTGTTVFYLLKGKIYTMYNLHQNIHPIISFLDSLLLQPLNTFVIYIPKTANSLSGWCHVVSSLILLQPRQMHLMRLSGRFNSLYLYLLICAIGFVGQLGGRSWGSR